MQRTHTVRDDVLMMIVFERNFVEILAAPFLVTHIVIVLFGIAIIVFAQEMDLLVAIQISNVNLFQRNRCVHTLSGQPEFGH